ncbi:ABC transporter ATP-binding protein [Desulfosporosinus sp. PR]|uniref:ABC transporter ATP-binding protein n=1 Tax=Candidatus Desulfosporosinus nitrosoreducens TaxID=3401928 RepID=UPI0027F27CF6|nr:ABC transporter ATP-binding protein [Desulfosporosinus sp. PR]MDQ7094559.1 ABC transporter ATP-binding protein [Desulfosporosinus sp. PR]
MRFELKDIKCGYGGKTVLQDISFAVEAGEVLCVLGPNGTGKTTLFKTILGLLKPLAGEILIDGNNSLHWSRTKMAQVIGYIPQAQNTSFPFSVMDMILMGRTAHLGNFASPTKKDRKIAEQVIATLDISLLKQRIFTELSGGEKQLVLIARALAQEPKMLVMDEPTSALDFGNQLKVLGQVKELARQGLAIIMASHVPDHAFFYATKVMLLNQGGLFGLGKANEVITEKGLRELYGVNVKIIGTGIISDLDGQGEVRMCVPLPGPKN